MTDMVHLESYKCLITINVYQLLRKNFVTNIESVFKYKSILW